MKNVKKISGVYFLKDEKLCSGEIRILSKSDRTTYVSWEIHDEEKNNIASVAKNYFIGDMEYSNDDIFQMVVKDILKYRIGRKKVFKEIKMF
jgi:hypothetical protein